MIKGSKQKICSLIIERKHEKGKDKAIDLYCRLTKNTQKMIFAI